MLLTVVAGGVGVLPLGGCAERQRSNPSPPAVATLWPEADALLHQAPRWLGGDAAFSVPLGDGRILWLFGDTFVATSARHVRSESKMVHNTIGIQRGDDPTTATMRFYWRGSRDAPESFFADEGVRYFWPGHGVRLGPALVLFFQRVKSTPGQGLGFKTAGWAAAIIDDASGDPGQWSLRMLVPTSAPVDIAVGAAVYVNGDEVVALAQREKGDHAGFLVRWTRDDLLGGQIDLAEWWTSNRGWVRQADLHGAPSSVMSNAGPECSLHFEPTRGQWVHVRSDGFGASSIVAFYADRPEGPWPPPHQLFWPPESKLANVLVYAAKGHSELAADGALAVTYATNRLDDFAGLVIDTSLYYPRFVKVAR
jgi:hypothetical protein